MNLNYERDEKIRSLRAFYMHKKCFEILKQLYVYLTTPDYKQYHRMLNILRLWLLNPFSVWPVDIHGACEHVCIELKEGRGIDPEMAALIELLEPIPSDAEQNAVGCYEFAVELGDYSALVKNHAKYKSAMTALGNNPAFHTHWKRFISLYDLDKIAGKKTVIRRTMLGERNFRVKEFFMKWLDKKSRFQHVLDALCWRFELYGFEKVDGKWVPLLMKVTVNVTPHGLMIYVPRWMSLDLSRDLILKAISDLHKTRGVMKQGPKMSENRLDKQRRAIAIARANRAALADGLEGEKRYAEIRRAAGLHRSVSERTIRKLISIGEELLAAEEGTGNFEPETSNLEPSPSASALRLARARAALAPLTPDEREMLLKEQSA